MHTAIPSTPATPATAEAILETIRRGFEALGARRVCWSFLRLMFAAPNYLLLIFTTGICEDMASVRPHSRAADLKHASPLTKALTKAL